MKNQEDQLLKKSIQKSFNQTIESNDFTLNIMSKIEAKKISNSKSLLSIYWRLGIFLLLGLIVIWSFVFHPNTTEIVLPKIRFDWKFIGEIINENRMVIMGTFIVLGCIGMDIVYRSQRKTNA